MTRIDDDFNQIARDAEENGPIPDDFGTQALPRWLLGALLLWLVLGLIVRYL